MEYQSLERSVITGEPNLLKIKGKQSQCTLYCGQQSLACDDGNNLSGDGCNEFCEVEQGFTCIKNGIEKAICTRIYSFSNQQAMPPICGNGLIERGEECDDQNLVLPQKRKIMLGFEQDFRRWAKTSENQLNQNTEFNECIKDSNMAYYEECDDGDQTHQGGCDSQCRIKEGFTCHTQFGKKSICYPNCALGSSQCLDQNKIDNDGDKKLYKQEISTNFLILQLRSEIHCLEQTITKLLQFDCQFYLQKWCDQNCQIREGYHQNLMGEQAIITKSCFNSVTNQCYDNNKNPQPQVVYSGSGKNKKKSKQHPSAHKVATKKMEYLEQVRSVMMAQLIKMSINIQGILYLFFILILIILLQDVMISAKQNKVGPALKNKERNPSALRDAADMGFNAQIKIVLLVMGKYQQDNQFNKYRCDKYCQIEDGYSCVLNINSVDQSAKFFCYNQDEINQQKLPAQHQTVQQLRNLEESTTETTTSAPTTESTTATATTVASSTTQAATTTIAASTTVTTTSAPTTTIWPAPTQQSTTITTTFTTVTTTPEPAVVKQCKEVLSAFESEGEQITCKGMTSCPNGSIPPCVWVKKITTKCTVDSQNSNGRDLQSGISARLRMVSNGLPNHCFESGQQSTPRENQIDFEIRFKNKPRKNLKRNRVLEGSDRELEGSDRVLEDTDEEITMTLYNGDNQLSVNMALCDDAWTQTGFITSLYPDYIEYSGYLDGIVGIALNGVPIHTGNSEYGSDVYYPKSFGSKLYSSKKINLDTCLGSSEFSGYYHYYGWSPCILPRGPINSYFFTSCKNNEACLQDPLAYSLSFMTPQEKTIMIIGVARDGHSILGPYRRDGMLWQPCDVDLCNGVDIGGVYYYVTTMFHPYTVGCWGPSPMKTIAQQCSNNVQVCSGASMVKFFVHIISPIILVYFTMFM
ncbi:UNKNOWN [Stylonychia lemnae]|uniref:Uncharacterized protein n=1 Tax=Stylonychia lemnae TaxID=5949 RepID=A0A078A6Z4_STYLE|nr:UNKNOWN [Stylonychia lemnae]|eukprot:CDW78025.1 UNKNOWN [Stylonychia lemnae]